MRYKMYLALKKSHPDKFLVPCYDIDLVWHTHQVHPALYYGDTMGLLGFVLKVSAASYGAVTQITLENGEGSLLEVGKVGVKVSKGYSALV